MGLPDTSPTPKKDSMGMDYIPVYEGDDTDDGSVKLSPGKIQRTGVKSEPAARRVIRTMIRAPGTIQLDERRVSVDLDAVRKFRPEGRQRHDRDRTSSRASRLMEVYSPAVSSAAAEYLATITSQTTSGDGRYGRGSRQRLVNLDVPEAAIAAIEKSRDVPTLHRVDRAARRHRAGAQRGRGHARAARRRPVPDRRSFAWSGR